MYKSSLIFPCHGILGSISNENGRLTRGGLWIYVDTLGYTSGTPCKTIAICKVLIKNQINNEKKRFISKTVKDVMLGRKSSFIRLFTS